MYIFSLAITTSVVKIMLAIVYIIKFNFCEAILPILTASSRAVLTIKKQSIIPFSNIFA